ncbi:hypothetical protein CAPTEDRAFT_97664 [Capitella teleta]|uniref:Uncharacterized protein n=1 Tax=Capitella teleta TaxID=283909 RepID=R7VC49_CAPTE|nr:hypothetical protein CAPTEDRAFT_97664 [Capitella teleta]|eukprot:ELU16174.1 hypothetical protein CAPTEDRAFT_97664 [Capitella teleta]
MRCYGYGCRGNDSPPSSGCRRPASILMNVVFPVPFSPNMTMISESVNSPASMDNLKEPGFRERNV